MTLTKLAAEDTDAFLALCDKLRAKGVVKLGALVLGPLPPPDRDADRKERDPDAQARRDHEIMFAACRVKPPFEPRSAPSDLPRAVVQRRERDEASVGKVTRR